MTKVCSSCGTEKPVGDFNRRNRRLAGDRPGHYASRCKSCRKTYDREIHGPRWRAANADLDRRRQKYWRTVSGINVSLRVGKAKALALGVEVVDFTAKDLLSRWENNRIDGTKCVYCQGPRQCLDHVIALKSGGSHSADNLVPACISCNSSKGATQLADWLQAIGKPSSILELVSV